MSEPEEVQGWRDDQEKIRKLEAENAKLRKVLKNLDGPTLMRDYDVELREHPHFKAFIAHTPFENDCAAIAWSVVRRKLPAEFWETKT